MLPAACGPQSWPGTRVWLRGGAYPARTRSPARPGCWERWLDHRSSCRAQGEPDSAMVREEKRESQWYQHGQRCQQSRPQRASPIRGRWASAAQHRRLPGPRQQKGWKNQPIFPLNLLSSLPPTPSQLGAGWLRRSKSGREKQEEGSKRQGRRPRVPAPRPG